MSSWVSNTWAVVSPNSSKLLSQACTRSVCPTAAAACSWWMLSGRSLQPSRVMPAATAPEDTSTTSTPLSRRATICCTHTAMAPRSRPRPSPVSNALPILITHRRAAVTLSRMQYQLRSAHVDNFRTVFVILILVVEVVLVVDDAVPAARLAIGPCRDTGSRIVLDALYTPGDLSGLSLVLSLAQLTLIEAVHGRLGQFLGARALGSGDLEDRTIPPQPLDLVI